MPELLTQTRRFSPASRVQIEIHRAAPRWKLRDPAQQYLEEIVGRPRNQRKSQAAQEPSCPSTLLGRAWQSKPARVVTVAVHVSSRSPPTLGRALPAARDLNQGLTGRSKPPHMNRHRKVLHHVTPPSPYRSSRPSTDRYSNPNALVITAKSPAHRPRSQSPSLSAQSPLRDLRLRATHCAVSELVSATTLGRQEGVP
jgi:hypothetical protein